MKLAEQIVGILKQRPGLKAIEIAHRLGTERAQINHQLYFVLKDHVVRDAEYRWRLQGPEAARSAVAVPARGAEEPAPVDEFIAITPELLAAIQAAIAADLRYQGLTRSGRKLGITGEVGEILVCAALGLNLATNPRAEGYDAMDQDGLRVQIKTRRGEKLELPRDSGRLSRFADHPFDYALMVILTREYRLSGVWRADADVLAPVIRKHKRRDPAIHEFKAIGRKVYP